MTEKVCIMNYITKNKKNKAVNIANLLYFCIKNRKNRFF